MKKLFLPTLITATLFTNISNAQTNRAYAITGENKGNYVWTSVREIDLSNGTVVKTLFSNAIAANVNYRFINADGKNNTFIQSNIPTANGVAASAYDAKNNRLYFCPMWNNDLRYFDLNNAQPTVVVNEDNHFSTGTRVDESNVITRMVFAADGNGYALTNDGKQFIKFTTDAKPTITNLGSLIDSKKNEVSVHAQCSSWGGDLIADVYGNLYLFTYRNHVFKINIATRLAEHIGTVKNLPNNFTTNGAAVNENGEVFISSAVLTDNYYSINLSTLDAKPIDKTDATVYNSSDLANGNLAYRNTKANPIVSDVVSNNNIAIYPNPSINKTFAVQFSKMPLGNYTVEVCDANGKKVITKNVIVSGLQNEKINLPKGVAQGLYFVKVTNNNGKAIYSDKVVVQ